MGVLKVKDEIMEFKQTGGSLVADARNHLLENRPELLGDFEKELLERDKKLNALCKVLDKHTGWTG